ncbi:Protein of unknown function [Propionibacterium freudenreichii subsp. freudenreichii]|uniref:Uncharacterized protein n=2 Tax=Propionibacterium freudenreichii TaxID=1744 RepID=D7GDA7_PROFC|nr:Hypothetical protein PFREUD_09930 [Propionibacterium freudenreichii subsp. shermanii CIRM-BIA1]CEG88811.1 Protein of unknown function [Propionibacterium freudenreichii]CEP26848.1 Protein of unknown function [Propionibacterium freudenreichii subsp. freudenreichii]CEG93065.1 Protein of unknown function [Propionibacterium freudenreichii]CEG97735.1 Protein of unknown function [Propionibacterium freudenreichii]
MSGPRGTTGDGAVMSA